MPVRISGRFGGNSAGNYDNSAPVLDPTNKFIAVITFICKDQLSAQIKRFQQCLCHANIIPVAVRQQKMQWITKPIRYRMDFSG